MKPLRESEMAEPTICVRCDKTIEQDDVWPIRSVRGDCDKALVGGCHECFEADLGDDWNAVAIPWVNRLWPRRWWNRIALFSQIVFRQWDGVRLWPWLAWRVVKDL